MDDKPRVERQVPFVRNSNRSYNVLFKTRSGEDAQAQIEAFDDTWTWSQQSETEYEHLVQGEAPPKVADAIEAMRKLLDDNDVLSYLVMMTARLLELRRVLKPTGSLYLHCDPTASHYLKVVADAVFGTDNFRNEISWQRTATKGDARRKFGAIHDVILLYSKGPEPYFLGLQSVHGDKYTSRFVIDDGDGRGAYEGAPLDSPNPRPNLTYDYKGYPPPANGWRVSRAVMERLEEDGRLIFPSRPGGRIRRKNYLAELKGRPIGDVWTDIAPLNSQAQERLGYPTQKPMALLERIITASSRPGNVVLDPFCGCGTTVDAAQKLGRSWIGIDISYLAVALIQNRLADTFGPEIARDYQVVGIPHDWRAPRRCSTPTPSTSSAGRSPSWGAGRTSVRSATRASTASSAFPSTSEPLVASSSRSRAVRASTLRWSETSAVLSNEKRPRWVYW